MTLVGTLPLVSTTAPARATTPLEEALHVLVNVTRIAHGKQPLVLRQWLSKIAHRHSKKMAAKRTLFHSCLSCKFQGHHYSVVAENVGVAKSIQSVHQAMMDTPGHKANILSGEVDLIGVGVVKRNNQVWVTEIFYG